MGQFKQGKDETMVLGLGHSLILGHMPFKVPENDYNKVNLRKQSVESYGFFSSPDYNTFYPGVTKEDFSPNDEDFIEPVYRLLSEVIVNKSYNPVDFSMGGVLKASSSKLIGQTVNCDHSTDIANAIGSIKHTYWQETFKDAGLQIPSGINGILKIDAKANPRIARGILMTPPSIHSNSVSVRFSWDKSHPKLDDNDFWNKLGTFDEKGELIRKVCSYIHCYNESSLVSHGADPFAQKVNENGGIALPKYTAAQDYAQNRGNSVEYYFMDYKGIANTDVLNNTMVFNMSDNKAHKKQNNMTEEELKLFLATLFGTGMLTLSGGKEVTKETLTETIKNLVSENKTLKASVSTGDSEIATLKQEKADLKQKLTANTEMVELGNTYIGDYRTKVVETYKKVSGETHDENIVSLINSASIAQLKSLDTQYSVKLGQMFPNKCSDCGSINIARSSSDSFYVDNKKPRSKNFEDIMNNILDSSQRISPIFPENNKK